MDIAGSRIVCHSSYHQLIIFFLKFITQIYMKNNLKQPEVAFLSLIPFEANFHSDIVEDEFIAEVFKK